MVMVSWCSYQRGKAVAVIPRLVDLYALRAAVPVAARNAADKSSFEKRIIDAINFQQFSVIDDYYDIPLFCRWRLGTMSCGDETVEDLCARREKWVKAKTNACELEKK
jgi:hypothetical protein